MTCTVDAREDAAAAAARLRPLAAVAAVDTLAPGVGPIPGWTLEVTIEAATVPPAVQGVAAELGLALDPAATARRPTHTTAAFRC